MRWIPGGDLPTGSKNSHIAALVGRDARYTMPVKEKSKDTASVVHAPRVPIRKLPAELRRSLTGDRGAEMAHHKEFSVAIDVKAYFCDPLSTCQCGTIQNTNRLLRQYFPKGTSISPAIPKLN